MDADWQDLCSAERHVGEPRPAAEAGAPDPMLDWECISVSAGGPARTYIREDVYVGRVIRAYRKGKADQCALDRKEGIVLLMLAGFIGLAGGLAIADLTFRMVFGR